MADLTIKRFCYAPFGVYGMLSLPGGQRLYTVEKPWLGNRPGESCIPTGIYDCAPRYYYGGGYDAIEVLDVPNRSHILFHIANVPADVKGCIGVGVDTGWVKGQWAVTSSQNAFAEFMRQMDREFTLEIQTACD